MKHRIRLLCVGVSLDIEFFEDCSLYEQIVASAFLKAYIPRVEIIEGQDNVTPDLKIHVITSYDSRVEFTYPTARYYCMDPNINDLITLCEFYFERARQERNIFCLHGSVGIINNGAVILWGAASGLGKTSLALAFKKIGGDFFADEKILLSFNNSMVVGGVKNIYASKQLYKENSGNVDFIRVQTNTTSNDYKILCFIQPLLYRLNDEGFFFDQWHSNKFEWHLYEELSRKIRGTSRRFFSGSFPAVSLDTFELASKRIEQIRKFVPVNSAYYIAGSEERILQKIQELTNV